MSSLFDINRQFLVWTSLAVILLVFLARAFLKWFRMFAYLQGLPGDPEISIPWGHMHHFHKKTGEERIDYILGLVKKYPKFAKVMFTIFNPQLLIYHPETVKVIYKSSAPKAKGLSHAYSLIESWIGNGLIVSNHGTWARSRRLLTPAFHFGILKNYMKIFNQATDILIKKLDKLAEVDESFDISALAKLFTLDVVMKCSMGYDINVQECPDHPYVKATKELGHLIFERPFNPLEWWDPLYRLTSNGRRWFKSCDIVHKVADTVIAERKKFWEKESLSKRDHLDFLDVLLAARDEDGNSMTESEIRHEVDTFMFAGHDTTSVSLSWFLYNMAGNKKHQDLVFEEVENVLADHPDTVKWENLTQFEYLSMCLKEAMRLQTTVPFIQRILEEETEIDGYKIPSGTVVGISIFGLHMNPAVWDEPEKYKPERFSAKNKENMDNFCFTPFSAGSRNCIGQNFALNQLKTVLSKILHRYEFEIDHEHQPPQRKATAVLSTDNGIWLKVKRR